MADISKKDKLIEDAHKHALLGQFDKTAKIYEQILASEPAAINLRQKLAEYLIKSGRNDDARKELETIGNHFSNNGFFLKAIAIYKQLQKLFPADISLSLKLAELNEKHGLVANSLSEYRLVYEFYENAGDISAAFDILDRMQKVDPRNIPVKIKLAEAYAQQEKKAESYALFAKTAALLLEQGDNAAFSNICIRVRQLFPDKPDFLLELLAEQIRSGNATAAIGSLQNIIRSNPHNKPAWDLIVQAYQLLEQPQRVKTACQHYLNFFPAEPAAILGLISSVTAEQNPAEALKLLDRYEATLISAGFLQQLEQIYLSLDKIDPINIKVVEGLIRIATAAGNENEVRLLTSKLQLLSAISGDIQNGSTESESPSDVFCTTDSPVFGESPLEQEMTPDFENLATDTTSAAVLSDAALKRLRSLKMRLRSTLRSTLTSPLLLWTRKPMRL